MICCKYNAEAVEHLRAKFYTRNNIFWFHCHKGLVEDISLSDVEEVSYVKKTS